MLFSGRERKARFRCPVCQRNFPTKSSSSSQEDVILRHVLQCSTYKGSTSRSKLIESNRVNGIDLPFGSTDILESGINMKAVDKQSNAVEDKKKIPMKHKSRGCMKGNAQANHPISQATINSSESMFMRYQTDDARELDIEGNKFSIKGFPKIEVVFSNKNNETLTRNSERSNESILSNKNCIHNKALDEDITQNSSNEGINHDLKSYPQFPPGNCFSKVNHTVKSSTMVPLEIYSNHELDIAKKHELSVKKMKDNKHANKTEDVQKALSKKNVPPTNFVDRKMRKGRTVQKVLCPFCKKVFSKTCTSMTDILDHIDKCSNLASPIECRSKDTQRADLPMPKENSEKFSSSSLDNILEQGHGHHDRSQSMQSIIQEGTTKKAFEAMLIRYLDPTYYSTHFDD